MNINRNTLYYRLEKIKELVDLDLEDSETRAYILISLKMNYKEL
jgi:DNA-binding PucR family transcriptional regulator